MKALHLRDALKRRILCGAQYPDERPDQAVAVIAPWDDARLCPACFEALQAFDPSIREQIGGLMTQS